MIVKVNESKCPQNHPCPSIKVCAVGAITQKGFNAPQINMNKCISCKKCIKFCPMKAIYSEN